MYIHSFLLRMTDTVTCQNIDISSWDTLYIKIDYPPLMLKVFRGRSLNTGVISDI